jgi:predicted Zn-dependent protease with MMP-like domain
MTPEEFERLVGEEFPNAIPSQFLHLISNVAFLIEEQPDAETRTEHGLSAKETLLGLYRGIPFTARGEGYGVGGTLPDTITLYRLPLLEETERLVVKRGGTHEQCMRQAIRETIWHEVAHHFGMDERQVRHREDERNELP